METKACKECGKDLPVDSFRKIRGGYFVNTCKECESLIRWEKKEQRKSDLEKQRAYFDSEFEGKEPVEIIQLMGRAKKWLEARGYKIELRGSLMVKKEVKFE